MSYLKVRSWHQIASVTDSGWHTRCGLNVTQSAPASDRIPLGEPSCESCLRLTAHDAEPKPVDNEEAGE